MCCFHVLSSKMYIKKCIIYINIYMYKTEETAGEVGQGCVQFMSLCINIKEIHFL